MDDSGPIMFGAAFLIVGIVFWWSNQHESRFVCLYSDKECSLAVGTWVLADVTLAAFVGAAIAAFFAVNAAPVSSASITHF